MVVTKIITAEVELGFGSIIVLTEKTGDRAFPIFIGFYEASAIDRHVKGNVPPRPLTHDLMNNIITGMGGTLEKVVVNALQQNTFFAQLIIRQPNGERCAVDARPSDALALAVRANAEIEVAPSVLDEAGI